MYTHTHDFDDNELPPKCYKLMGFFKNKKNVPPMLRMSILLDSSRLYHDLPGNFPFSALNPLEIHVFPQSFGIRPEIPTTFTPFPSPELLPLEFDILNMSTGGLRLPSGKSQYITWYKLTQIFAKSKMSFYLFVMYVYDWR